MSRYCPGIWLVLSILSLPLAVSGAATGDGRVHAASAPVRWPEDLDLLATEREKNLFSGLHGDAEREQFLQQFWQARDPFVQTSRNELREEWDRRVLQAGEQWGGLDDDRTRSFLLRGEPSSRFEARCPSSGNFEVWTYEPAFRKEYRAVLVFLVADGRPARLWRPGSSLDLAAAAAEPCSNQKRLHQEAAWINGQEQYGALLDRALARPQPREWTSMFRNVTVDAPENAPQLDADMNVEYAGLQGNRVVVRVQMLVSPRSSQAAPPAEGREYALAGQVLRGTETLEAFLYRLHGQPSEKGELLVFERVLAPGAYVLRVHLEDVKEKSLLLKERDLSVPVMTQASAAPAAGAPPEAPSARPDSVLAEADAALSPHGPGLRLVQPSEPVLVGPVRFSAEVEPAQGAPPAERIARVAFSLDGKPLLTRNRAPFDLTVDLGPQPRPRKLRAEGIAGDGTVVAHDEILINGGARGFRVRLLEPRSGRVYQKSVRILADVTPPPGAAVERLELFFGEERIATLYQPPYSQPFLLPQAGQSGYLRAVAYLAGGGSCEDTVFVNMPAEPDEMDVRMVELYATVLDDAGLPAPSGLDAGSFVVLEDGERQAIRAVERAGTSPVRLAALIDSSLSMMEEIGQARQAALEFLRRFLRPQDQAAVISFNRAPEMLVPLTGDLGQVEEGLQWIMAEGTTALYDSLVYTLLYLGQTQGQRAVLLLSDGMDRTSRLGFEQTLEVARRTGVAVYAIGMGVENGPGGEGAQKLARLARATGGRSFFAENASQLDEIYTQIEQELRSQYRISYQSSNTKPDGAFRAVQLRMAAGGLEARTISGYYP